MVRTNLVMLSLVIATAAFVGAALEAGARDVSPADLVKAAQAARISQIDYSVRDCKDERRVDEWLKEVLGDTAQSIKWGGGRCVLAIRGRTRDAGTRWCAHADIKPKRGEGRATVEVYFERPVKGRPGAPFAFRASVMTKDGPDYVRETWAFEDHWKEAHVPGHSSEGAPRCQ